MQMRLRTNSLLQLVLRRVKVSSWGGRHWVIGWLQEMVASWFSIGSLIKKYFGLSRKGLNLFLDFSRKCVDKFDEYECEKTYKKIDEDNNYTIGTLYFYSKM